MFTTNTTTRIQNVMDTFVDKVGFNYPVAEVKNDIKQIIVEDVIANRTRSIDAGDIHVVFENFYDETEYDITDIMFAGVFQVTFTPKDPIYPVRVFHVNPIDAAWMTYMAIDGPSRMVRDVSVSQTDVQQLRNRVVKFIDSPIWRMYRVVNMVDVSMFDQFQTSVIFKHIVEDVFATGQVSFVPFVAIQHEMFVNKFVASKDESRSVEDVSYAYADELVKTVLQHQVRSRMIEINVAHVTVGPDGVYALWDEKDFNVAVVPSMNSQPENTTGVSSAFPVFVSAARMSHKDVVNWCQHIKSMN